MHQTVLMPINEGKGKSPRSERLTKNSKIVTEENNSCNTVSLGMNADWG